MGSLKDSSFPRCGRPAGLREALLELNCNVKRVITFSCRLAVRLQLPLRMLERISFAILYICLIKRYWEICHNHER